MGQRATVSGSATFDDVTVDPGLVVPYESAFAVPQQLGARAQLWHAAIQVGIAGGALRDAGAFVRGQGPAVLRGGRGRLDRRRQHRPAHHAPVRRAGHQGRGGRGAARVGRRHAGRGDPVPARRHEAARGSVAVAQAKAFGSEVAVEVASDLFALSGASAADERHDLEPPLAQRPHARRATIPPTGSTTTSATSCSTTSRPPTTASYDAPTSLPADAGVGSDVRHASGTSPPE